MMFRSSLSISGRNNVCQIASQRLCTSCGACLGVCPEAAIRFDETVGGYLLPVVDEQKCIKCGLCLAVCPGIHFGKTLRSKIVGDPFIGLHRESFVGKATSHALYENSQSGGIVSALLTHGLEAGKIKGAVTVVMQEGKPPRPEVRIARSSQEIFESQKSKYCPVPLLGVLNHLENEEGPLALVGTSCQIHGLFNVLDKKPGLRDKFAFTIGLVCDRVMTYAALDSLLNESRLYDGNTPMMFHFRDKSLPTGYPGDVHISTVGGKSVVLPAASRMRIKDYFTPARCRLCFDKMNVFADITVGDPHGLPDVDRQRGESMLVIRTEKGQAVVQSAQHNHAIDIRQVAYDQILNGQNVDRKKEQWRANFEAWKNIGRTCPDYYPIIERYAFESKNFLEYSKSLEHSLNIDRFATRQDLIRFVAKNVRRKQVMNRLLAPFRLVQRFMKKLCKI